MSISPVNFINGLLKSVKKKPEAISSKVVDCGQIQDTILKLPENIDLNRFVPADVVNNNVLPNMKNKLLTVLGIGAVGGYSINKAVDKGQRVFSTTA